MSLHAVHVPTREELIRAVANKPVSRTVKLGFAALAALGAVLFVVGAVQGEDRAWLALMYNWLFFTIISAAGVAFAAVQRLTTARWSRPVVRFIEGYVAWMPVAFVLLLLILFFSGDHIFTWAGRETIHTPQKAIYLNPTFFRIRGVVLFGLMTAFYTWFVYRSVRLDVGVIHAYIKPENHDSRRAFCKAGFELAGETIQRGQPAVHFIRERGELQ